MPAWLTPQFALNLLMAVIMGIVAVDRMLFRARKQQIDDEHGQAGLGRRITALEKRMDDGVSRWSDKHNETMVHINALLLDMREVKVRLELDKDR